MELIRAPVINTLYQHGGVDPEDLGEMHIYLAAFEPPDKAAFSWVLFAESLYESASMIYGHEAFNIDDQIDPAWLVQITEITAGDLKNLDYKYV